MKNIKTLDDPQILLIRSQCATDAKPWLPAEAWLKQVRRGRWGRGEGAARPIPEPFNFPLPYCCRACKRGCLVDVEVKRCSRCKLVRHAAPSGTRRDDARLGRFLQRWTAGCLRL